MEKTFKNGYPFQDMLSFYQFLKKKKPFSTDSKYHGRAFLAHIRLLMIFSLLTGIKMSQLIELLWSDVLTLDENQKADAKTRLRFKGFNVFLTESLRKELEYHFTSVPYARLNGYIFLSDNGEPWNKRNLSRDIKSFLKEFDFEYTDTFETDSTRIMFGREVIKTHGFTKRIINELKIHFNKNSKEKLCQFLHIDSDEEKRQFEFHQSIVPLSNSSNWDFGKKGVAHSDFEPFQHFNSFYYFLMGNFKVIENTKNNAMFIPNLVLLLYLGLRTGIRLSKLTSLRWSDIAEFGNYNRLVLKQHLEFEGKVISLGAKSTYAHRIEGMYKKSRSKGLDDFVFKYNTGKDLNPKYLSRDIRVGLDILDYPFADKFKTYSTTIMFGRRVLERHGFQKKILSDLKSHLKHRTIGDMLSFLHIAPNEELPPPEITEGLVDFK